MIYYVIPARKGSKGLPGKNRKLFDHTAKTLEGVFNDKSSMVVVTTDDEEIKIKAIEYGFHVIDRPEILADDTASMRSVLIHTIAEMNMKPDDRIIMLYLTYPQRTFDDIIQAAVFHDKYDGCEGMLCREPIKDHPYLMMIDIGDLGKPLFTHNKYRRQDYPDLFKISHYIFIAYARDIFNLNENLYNNKTVYFKIDNVVDIDTPEDLERYEKMSLYTAG